MLVVYFFLSLGYLNCKSENIPLIKQQTKKPLITCISDIIEKYFSEQKVVTYVDMDSDANGLLKAIHSLKATAVVFRQSFIHSSFRHQGYLITAKTANVFADHFTKLPRESTWNPTARFLIVIKVLKEDELKIIFDVLIDSRVLNVLLVNETNEAQIYTYNPFENYACGKYYSRVINYGECLQTKTDLYPNKLVTGFKNCTFQASIANRAPFSVDSRKLKKNTRYLIGTEELVFKLLGQTEEFKINHKFDYNKTIYTTVTNDMVVFGPMKSLQNNETDVIFGGIWLVSSRADAFTYLYGHLDNADDLLIIVKKASFVENWKSTYLEFQPSVWLYLVITFLVYSALMIIILGTDDKSGVMLILLKHLLAHSCHIPNRSHVKRFILAWIWFSFLINNIYQSSLVSLTEHPLKEHQIRTDHELYTNKLKPCISPTTLAYLQTERNLSDPINNDCLDALKNIKKVGKSSELFTLVQRSFYAYHKKSFNDKFGESPVYYFQKPYAKLVFGIFFYKGFPITDKMRTNVIRFRESGLIDKTLYDHYYLRKIKYHFHEKDFEPRFVVPWEIYLIGCVLAIVVFVFELLCKHYEK